MFLDHAANRRQNGWNVFAPYPRTTARIKHGLQSKLFLGNLEAKRDWGYARDYVESMWLMLQQDEADDYAVATGESYSVREFLEAAFTHAGLDWKKHVELDPQYLRPNEVESLLGDPTKAREKLGWKPRTGFTELVHMMVDADMESAAREKTLLDAGHSVPGAGGARRG